MWEERGLLQPNVAAGVGVRGGGATNQVACSTHSQTFTHIYTLTWPSTRDSIHLPLAAICTHANRLWRREGEGEGKGKRAEGCAARAGFVAFPVLATYWHYECR